MEMHRSKLSAAAMLPIFTEAICGKTLSLGMSEKQILYMKNPMESLLCCFSPC